MSATRTHDSTTATPVLYLAFELGWREWKLGFSTSPAQPVRQRTVRARDLQGLGKEIAKAKQRFGLAPETAVRCCYEAGRDGFWLHRYLTARGVDSVVVDSASIEVKRRKRRVKSDRLDVDTPPFPFSIPARVDRSGRASRPWRARDFRCNFNRSELLAVLELAMHRGTQITQGILRRGAVGA